MEFTTEQLRGKGQRYIEAAVEAEQLEAAKEEYDELETEEEMADRDSNNSYDAFNIWLKWFQLRCNHMAYPTGEETWDGAIETIAHYLRNELLLDNVEQTNVNEFVSRLVEKFQAW